MPFNAPGSSTGGARLAGGALLLAAAAAAALSAEEPAPAAPAPAAAKSLTAAQRQGIARLRGAWWVGRALRENTWSDFDPNGIPVLMVERREDRAPWALSMNHPSPGPGFATAAAASDEGPAVLVAAAPPLIRRASSPAAVGGIPTAVVILGETIPDGPLGAEPGDRSVTRIVHEMVHVHAASKGLPAGLAPEKPPAIQAGPELLALTGVENRILADFLYTDTARSGLSEEFARRFLAVRRARRALLGAAAAEWERRAELAEAAPTFAEVLVTRWCAMRQVEPPPMQEADPTYRAFQFGLIFRVDLVVGRLLASPTTAAHLAARAPSSGAAQAMVLERLGADWREKVFKPDTVLADLIAEKVPLEAAQQGEVLAQAREANGYAAFLALARGE